MIGEEILTEAIVLMYPPSLALPDDRDARRPGAVALDASAAPNAIRTLIDAAFASNNLSVNVVVEIDSLHSAMDTVRRGFGVGATTMGAIKEDLEAERCARERWGIRRS